MIRKIYSTKRFVIRPYTMKDYKKWFKAYTNLLPKQSTYDRGPYTAFQCTKEEYKKLVDRHRLVAKEGKTYIWGIFDESGDLLGAVDIYILHIGPLQMANLGYRILNNHWRKGIAREVLKEIMPKVLMDLKLNRLEAVIDLTNKPSIKLAQSLRLRREGIRRNFYYQNKDWHDQVVFVADRKLLKLPTLKL